jgi:cytochrome d ubiquinol oxidase subunit I
MRAGVRCAAVLIPLQILAGDLHGLNTLEHQPAKIAAMEAIWHTERGVPLVLLAIPNEELRRNDYAIELPYGASLVLKHSARAELKGLNEVRAQPPAVAPLFFGVPPHGRRRRADAAGFLGSNLDHAARGRRAPVAALGPRGIHLLGLGRDARGWIVTEMGRQPWLVTGILLTRDAVGPITGAQLGASLTGYILTYSLMLVAYMVVLTHLARAAARPRRRVP